MRFLQWYVPIVIVAVALNLRPALLTLGPVLPEVQRALALSPFGSGLLTALPILALGVASALAVPVARRLGFSGGLVFALALIGAGTLLRSAGGEAPLYAGALVLGMGIGLGNVYVPTLVKARLAGRIGLAMGVYTMMLTTSALVSVSLTPQLLAHFGDWKPTLAVWALPAFLGMIVATPLLVDNIRPRQRAAGMGLWRNGLAWAVSAFMGLQSALFYALALWLGALIAARGVSLPHVAADLTAFYFMQFVTALGAPVLLTKTRRQDIAAVVLVAFVGAAIVAVLYGPLDAVFVMCGVLGLALGAVFAVALTFQVIRARTPENAARLSSMAQCVGYIIASLGPMVLGLVSHAENARFAAALWLAALAIATMSAGSLAGQQHFVDAD
jgi:CP family cyanate transporter-like MFS transporter